MATEAPKQAEPKAEPKTEKSAVDVLAAKKKELAELQAKHELLLVQEQIDRLNNGGLSAAAVKRRDLAREKREKTVKETIGEGKDAKVLALYRLTEKSFRPVSPGGLSVIQQPGTIVRIPYELLPGASMEAIKRVAADEPVAFAKA